MSHAGISIEQIVRLIGGDLQDGSAESKRFREFISQSQWPIEQYQAWIDECIHNKALNRPLQDIIVTLGERLGFSVEYGRYHGRSGEIGYDGLWKRDSGEVLLLEIKSSTWPIESVAQLGKYMDAYAEEAGIQQDRVFGLYVIGKGDTKALEEQILGSLYRTRIRVIYCDDLIELLRLQEDLKPRLGSKEASSKAQALLFPLESVNVGSVVKLILDIARIRFESPPVGRPTREKRTAQLKGYVRPQGRVDVNTLLEHGFLQPGDRLRAQYKGKVYWAEITKDGQIKYKGKKYSSLSKAGGAIMGGRSCNGWKFWEYEIEPDVFKPIDDLRRRFAHEISHNY